MKDVDKRDALVSIKLVTPSNELPRGDFASVLSGLLDPVYDGFCTRPFCTIRIMRWVGRA
jgi:hypothetical protein